MEVLRQRCCKQGEKLLRSRFNVICESALFFDSVGVRVHRFRPNISNCIL